ncbi:MAG: sigma-70 family RNA polymerase sigma factor [Candidatus Limnocylindria bacterium]
MNQESPLTDRFEAHREHLRRVAYRMLGSPSEADDALQEAWIRVNRADPDDVENARGWLTTVVARVCLNMLRSRTRRREESLEGALPDPVVSPATELQPEDEALLADSVGLALFVVLDTLSPAERLAFVLHDTFGLPFDEIAPMVGRSSEAARQLASRARRRVRSADVQAPDADMSAQRRVVDAFFRAAREGDFAGLLRVLDPDAVLRSDFGARRQLVPPVVRGAEGVAQNARPVPGAELIPALVNGAAGVVVVVKGRPFALMGFTVRDDRIVAIDAIADPERVERLAGSVLTASSASRRGARAQP